MIIVAHPGQRTSVESKILLATGKARCHLAASFFVCLAPNFTTVSIGNVAQLDSARLCEGRGRRFESFHSQVWRKAKGTRLKAKKGRLPISFSLFCFGFFHVFLENTRRWPSGKVSDCKSEDRGFDSRPALWAEVGSWEMEVRTANTLVPTSKFHLPTSNWGRHLTAKMADCLSAHEGSIPFAPAFGKRRRLKRPVRPGSLCGL